jgi:PTS system cellobiose-specific IIA component
MNNIDKNITSDEMNEIAMQIIMEAGDARLLIADALKDAAAGKLTDIDAKLSEAKKKLAGAHARQTAIVQNEGEGIRHEHTLLFIHAQDTLMTIFSELNMVKQLKSVFEYYDNRISALEKNNNLTFILGEKND